MKQKLGSNRAIKTNLSRISYIFRGQILTVVQQCRIDGQNTDAGTWQVQLDAMTSGLTLKETGYETGRSVRDAMSE